MCRSASQGGRRCPGSHTAKPTHPSTPNTPATSNTHTDDDGTTWEMHTFPDGSTRPRMVFDNSQFIAAWEKNEAAGRATTRAQGGEGGGASDQAGPEGESGRSSRWASNATVVNYAGGNDVVAQQIGHVGHRTTTTTTSATPTESAESAESAGNGGSGDDVPADGGASSGPGQVINLRMGNARVGRQIDSIDVQEWS